MVASQRLLRQLDDLNGVLDLLERMNVLRQTEVPTKVANILEASGLTGTKGLEPMALMPRVLDRQQLLRRQLASIRRTRVT